MSEREDVEADLELASIIRRAALIQPLGPNSRAVHDAGGAVMLTPAEAEAASRAVLASSWLVAHVEAVRVSERVRLAGEVEALADAYARMAEHRDTHAATRPVLREVADNIRALVPVPGVRLTEEA
jgi:hypothetical protein